MTVLGASYVQSVDLAALERDADNGVAEGVCVFRAIYSNHSYFSLIGFGRDCELDDVGTDPYDPGEKRVAAKQASKQGTRASPSSKVLNNSCM